MAEFLCVCALPYVSFAIDLEGRFRFFAGVWLTLAPTPKLPEAERTCDDLPVPADGLCAGAPDSRSEVSEFCFPFMPASPAVLGVGPLYRPAHHSGQPH